MNRSSEKFIASLVMAIVAGVVCLATCAAYLFAWFSSGPAKSNIEVDTREERNLDIFLSTDGQIWSDELYDILFDDIFCGSLNRKILYVKCVNNDTKDLLVSLFFWPPDGVNGAEVPYISDNLYYYLGSQLQISDIRATTEGQTIDLTEYAVGKDKYLVATSSQGVLKGQANSVDAAIESIPRLDLLTNLTLPVGTTTIIEIEITFVDNGTNQNIFLNSENYVCIRKLTLR